MNVALEERPRPGLLGEYLRSRPSQGLQIHWLGQAGFVIDIGGLRLVIDPYLSNSLAEKYRGTARPHLRMTPAPILPEEIPFVDLVLCTHAHTDHMDPGTLPRLLSANPGAKLVAPRASRLQAMERSGASGDRLSLVRAGEPIAILKNLAVIPTRAAHESLETDGEGNHRFLGYAIRAQGVCLWHSGDCIPFDGLEMEVGSLDPDIALLPVNGRRAELSENDVPGNFFLSEAIDVTRKVGAAHMVAHHYGLFDFNTKDPDVIDRAAVASSDVKIHRAKPDIVLSSSLR
jgi:L-ascorbate metabolism protein UlaG (beta-lactamase superfamily)